MLLIPSSHHPIVVLVDQNFRLGGSGGDAPTPLVECGASLATVERASCPRRLEACSTNGRRISAHHY
ncbi:MAG: hypothetical protein WCA35_15050 [Kovacikia sp.]